MFKVDKSKIGKLEVVGIGIGLYTSNILTEALGGTIKIVSPICSNKINKGTEVSFTVLT